MSFTGRISSKSATGKRGAIFDSTTASKPIIFIAGSDEIIPGWSYGAVGMCMNEQRRLTIPPEWAFGSRGTRAGPRSSTSVPGNAAVEITMELLSVKPPPNLFVEMDTNKDKKVTMAELKQWLLKKGVPKSEVADAAKKLMEQDDKNKDGVISESEYTGPR